MSRFRFISLLTFMLLFALLASLMSLATPSTSASSQVAISPAEISDSARTPPISSASLLSENQNGVLGVPGGDDFQEKQAMATNRAADWASFTIGGETYLAVANGYDGSSLDSEILRWNGTSFVSLQSLATHGARDWEFFSIGSDHYLIVANSNNGSDSQLYKWNGARFDGFQAIATHGAVDWEFFTIDGKSYLVVANHYDGSTYSLDSQIYHWNGTIFEEYDSIATHGASDWEFFTIDGEHYLVVANHFQNPSFNIDSIMYRWNRTATAFVPFSTFPTSGAADWEYFTMNGEHYLALANRYNGSTYDVDSKIYRWNGTSFPESDSISIATSGATDWAFMTIEQQPYLFVSNSRDDSSHNVASQLYKWSEDQTAFVAEQSIATQGAVDGEFFTIESQSYLAVANKNDNSRLYEFSASSTLLGIYALAFDTKPTADLSWAYSDTIQGLLSTTNQAANKTAIVVVDMPGEDNTSVLEIRNGQPTPIEIEGLPDANGELSTTLREYDMTDGATLGGFLLWARNTYPADQTIFSYVGHGGPLIPETNYSRIFENNNRYPEGPKQLFPLPLRTDATPEFTDITPEKKFLSVYQLSEALHIGTREGSNKFAVLDLVHCFASTIEEYYGASPYAESMIGSPNYAYFAPEMPGQALDVADPNQSAGLMAQSIVSQYENLLDSYDRPETPADDHPRLLVAVDSSKISEIKQKWDDLSAQLWANFDRDKLETAYRNSAHYDTTYCEPQDWDLASPDAVVDLGTFATQLGQEFGAPVSDTVNLLLPILDEAVIERQAQAGDPWFADGTQSWRFDDNLGIGLYADLVGKLDGEESYLSWHARFYTDTVTSDNIHPYLFLRNSASGVSWADIFYKFWQDHPNANIQTSGCLPYLAPVPRSGTANLALTMSDDPDPVIGQQPLTYELSVSNFGPDSATEVVVSDTLPSAVNLVSSAASQGSCQEADGLVTCNLGTLPDGERATISIVVMPTRERVTLSNRAEVSSATPDVFLADNMASQETKILDESADLEITISDSFDPVLANNELVYQVTVQNHGPITGSSVTIRNTLPENVTFVSAIPSQRNNCTPSGRTVTCDLGRVPNGHTVKVDITVIPNTTGRLTNVANVESFTPDSNEENNAVQEQTIVSGEGMSINEVTPGYGFNSVPSLLYIHGFGFEQPLNVTLGNQQLNVIHDELVRIIAVVPSGLAPGLYDVTVNTSSHSATAGEAYQVLGAEDSIGDLLSLPEWLWSDPHPLRVGYADSGVGLKIQHLGGSSPLDSVTVEFRRDGPNGPLLGSSQTEPLTPDAIGSSGKVVWEPEEAGDYRVCAIIDPDNEVQETDETNNVICNTLTVLPPVEDKEAPEVREFVIDDDAESTAQFPVTLDVSATDYPIPGASGVRAIRFFEFEYILGARRWVQVKRSEWIDYATAQTNYSWSLVPTFGIRYMQAWAVDHDDNISHEPGEDVIDLLPSEQEQVARVEQHGVVFYRIYLEEGESFSATLTPLNGDPDLYVWGPSAQPWKSENSFTQIDTVQFKAPTRATYQIEVHGREASDYRLQFGTATAAQIRSWRAQDNPEKQSPEKPAVPLDETPQESAPQPPQPQEPQEPETYTIYLPITIR